MFAEEFFSRVWFLLKRYSSCSTKQGVDESEWERLERTARRVYIAGRSSLTITEVGNMPSLNSPPAILTPFIVFVLILLRHSAIIFTGPPKFGACWN